MVSIICLKWGTLYNDEYVNKLYDGVRKNTTIPHEFICFTENEEKIASSTKPLPHLNLKGWWNKMWLFNKELPVKYDRIFYLDLDTVICSNIDHIVSNLTQDFYILRDPYRPDVGWGSGLMSWRKGQEDLWETFNATSHRPGHGDQGFIQAHKKGPVAFWQDSFKDIISYKVEYRKGKRGSIVYFHGQPRPHEVQELWK